MVYVHKADSVNETRQMPIIDNDGMVFTDNPNHKRKEVQPCSGQTFKGEGKNRSVAAKAHPRGKTN